MTKREKEKLNVRDRSAKAIEFIANEDLLKQKSLRKTFLAKIFVIQHQQRNWAFRKSIEKKLAGSLTDGCHATHSCKFFYLSLLFFRHILVFSAVKTYLLNFSSQKIIWEADLATLTQAFANKDDQTLESKFFSNFYLNIFFLLQEDSKEEEEEKRKTSIKWADWAGGKELQHVKQGKERQGYGTS